MYFLTYFFSLQEEFGKTCQINYHLVTKNLPHNYIALISPVRERF
jgi:hypothetical protein